MIRRQLQAWSLATEGFGILYRWRLEDWHSSLGHVDHGLEAGQKRRCRAEDIGGNYGMCYDD